MSEGFSCDLDGFKANIAKFCKRAESGEYDEKALDLGWKYILLRYLNLIGPALDLAIAVTYLDYGATQHAKARMREYAG